MNFTLKTFLVPTFSEESFFKNIRRYRHNAYANLNNQRFKIEGEAFIYEITDEEHAKIDNEAKEKNVTSYSLLLQKLIEYHEI